MSTYVLYQWHALSPRTEALDSTNANPSMQIILSDVNSTKRWSVKTVKETILKRNLIVCQSDRRAWTKTC